MTLENIEAVFGRLTSVFLIPLVNIIFLSMIVYLISGGAGGAEQIKGLSSSILALGSAFLKGDTKFSVDAITNFTNVIKDYWVPIASASSVLFIGVWIIVVVFAYLIDRLTFYIGYFVPPTLEFDLEEYGILNKRARRSRRLSYLISKVPENGEVSANGEVPRNDEVPAFEIAYGAIRAYLGDKNTDKYRLIVRSKIARAIDRVKAAFCYTKAYCVLCILLLILIISSGRHLSVLGVALVIIALFAAFTLSCLFYASLFKQLIEYDIDSFIADRSYSSAQLNVPNFSGIEEHPDVPLVRTGFGVFLTRRCIKFELLEKLNS